ncbi:MAG: zf-HC2 domain-containing protein [Ilumatobacteraceae bacterium]
MMIRRRNQLVCKQAVTLMTDYLEGALTKRDRSRLETHLAGCPHCTEYLAQIRKTIEAAGHIEPDDLDPEVLDDLVALYRQWQAEQ